MHSTLFSLSGKVALITGASSGIGLAIAEAFAIQGATVVVASNDGPACDAVAQRLRRDGSDAISVTCDVTDRGQIGHMVQTVISQRGRIDVLVCNAGAAPHAGPIASATDAEWDFTMTLNLRSVLWLTSLVIPEMAARRDGSVILMSSISGVRGNKSIGLYGLSKAGLAELARNLAVEWGPQGVRVNAISPGVIRTSFAAPILANDEVAARRMALTPLRRAGEPREVAGVAVMLASAAGGFITGHNLIVDGGTTIGDGN